MGYKIKVMQHVLYYIKLKIKELKHKIELRSMIKNDEFEHLMQNIKHLPEIINKSKEDISKITAYGESGAGLVKVKINGKKEVIKIRINNSLMKEDKIIVEDLVTEAINNAGKKVDVETCIKIKNIMKNMGLPQH